MDQDEWMDEYSRWTGRDVHRLPYKVLTSKTYCNKFFIISLPLIWDGVTPSFQFSWRPISMRRVRLSMTVLIKFIE